MTRDQMYRARLVGGPKDRWVYDWPLTQDPRTWARVPHDRVGGFPDGEYRRSETEPDGTVVFRWVAA